ncbi:MAG: alpha/beta fold hydrolase [Micrococcaceae bacterium]
MQKKYQNNLMSTPVLTSITAGTVGAGLALGVSSLAKYIARTTVTIQSARQDYIPMRPIVEGDKKSVALPINEDTIAQGRYSIYFNDGAGFARIGKILNIDEKEQEVTREVENVSYGDFASAKGASWVGYIWDNPGELGLKYEDVYIPTENGPAPSWMVSANKNEVSDTCVIVVHGRGASKAEGLRAVPALVHEGLDVLLVNYRNDYEGPKSRSGVYGLGFTEWHDVQQGISYVLQRGAKRVILYGWSMGGAIVMRTYFNARYRNRIEGLILDAPALDWGDILRSQMSRYWLPSFMGDLAEQALSGRFGAFVQDKSAIINSKSLNWLEHTQWLKSPILIFHSTDDKYVPYGPSQELAKKRPDLVTYDKSTNAMHTKEWNVDPEYYNLHLKTWLRQHGLSDRKSAS